jgi:hypothetical protein
MAFARSLVRFPSCAHKICNTKGLSNHTKFTMTLVNPRNILSLVVAAAALFAMQKTIPVAVAQQCDATGLCGSCPSKVNDEALLRGQCGEGNIDFSQFASYNADFAIPDVAPTCVCACCQAFYTDCCINDPNGVSGPIVGTLAPIDVPIVIINTPAPIDVPIVIIETPAPIDVPIVDTPAPVAVAIVDTPAPVTGPVAEDVGSDGNDEECVEDEGKGKGKKGKGDDATDSEGKSGKGIKGGGKGKKGKKGKKCKKAKKAKTPKAGKGKGIKGGGTVVVPPTDTDVVPPPPTDDTVVVPPPTTDDTIVVNPPPPPTDDTIVVPPSSGDDFIDTGECGFIIAPEGCTPECVGIVDVCV